jgi:hypothetical protein
MLNGYSLLRPGRDQQRNQGRNALMYDGTWQAVTCTATGHVTKDP